MMLIVLLFVAPGVSYFYGITFYARCLVLSTCLFLCPVCDKFHKRRDEMMGEPVAAWNIFVSIYAALGTQTAIHIAGGTH